MFLLKISGRVLRVLLIREDFPFKEKWEPCLRDSTLKPQPTTTHPSGPPWPVSFVQDRPPFTGGPECFKGTHLRFVVECKAQLFDVFLFRGTCS